MHLVKCRHMKKERDKLQFCVWTSVDSDLSEDVKKQEALLGFSPLRQYEYLHFLFHKFVQELLW
jgi:hypothetical protein